MYSCYHALYVSLFLLHMLKVLILLKMQPASILPKKSSDSLRKTYSIKALLQKKLEYHILILTICVTNSNVDYNPKVQTKK